MSVKQPGSPSAKTLISQGRYFDALMSPADQQLALTCLYKLGMGVQAVPQALRLAERQERAGQTDEALQTLQTAINHDPQSVSLFMHAGLFQHRCGRLADARRCLERVVSLDPTMTVAYINLGIVLQDQGELEESVKVLNTAIRRQPGMASAWLNLGTAQMRLNRIGQAERSYRQALALQPDYVHARANLGMCQLWQGNQRDGWVNYEVRYQMPPHLQRVKPPTFPVPRWQGESLTGKRVLIWPEQGLGDQIMCAAWLSRLKQAAGIKQLVLACSRPLLPLFARLQGPDLLVDVYDAMPLCDFWLGAMSVPNALLQQAPRAGIDTQLTDTPPWLTADPRWLPAALQNRTEHRRIGLCWKGSTSYPGDAQRSFHLEIYNALLMMSGTRFVTLLPGTRQQFLDWGGAQVLDLAHEIDCDSPAFEETAAIMMSLDLIITSDTSIAHLAVALGRPTWLMLQFAGEWRWSVHPARDRGHLRVFQQAAPGDWHGVIQAVCRTLSAQ